MAGGQAMQSRLHAVNQAQLVWLFAQEFDPQLVQTFIDTGSFGETKKSQPNQLADRIVDDIYANGGKLVVDEAKFRRMAEEVSIGK